MENLLFIFNNLGLEVVIIALITFTLTMLLKIPIKKATSKHNENVRKALNTVIVFIPMILVSLLSILYYGLFKQIWFEEIVYVTMSSSYLLTILTYGFVSKIIKIFKGIKNVDNKEENYVKEAIEVLKDNSSDIADSTGVSEENANNIISKIEKMTEIRDWILQSSENQDLSIIDNLNEDIEKMKSEI